MTDIDALLKSLRKEEIQKFRSDMQDDGIEAADTINALLAKIAALESAAPVVQEPLTDEQIHNMWDGHTVAAFGRIGINPIVFARAIEKAHGIGGGK